MTNYLTKEEQKTLLAEYRAHGFKRFHSMNAAVKDSMQNIFFASYETVCFYWNKHSNTLYVLPFIYDKQTFMNSPTTNRQCNKWLLETFNDYGLTVKFLQDICKQNDANKRALYTYNKMRICFVLTQFYISDFKIVG